jgi:dTDP-4-amino-4,6-dideoxygalactose transaminase
MSVPAKPSEQEFIPFSPPQITDEEVAAVVEALRSPWITTGPQTRGLEEEFAEMHGSEAALAVNSCTAGMHVALLAHNIGPGDEVLVPTHTFCATANVVEHVGATPILVDVEPDTLNIDPEQAAAKITSRTKAIMPVHYAGHMAEMDDIWALVEKHGLHLIEDAAHPVSGKYRDWKVGSGKNLASFSFYATKNMTTAEGGILTGSRELIDIARPISLHGMDKDAWKRYDKGGSWQYDVPRPGFKYNMPDVLAALGRVQLKRLPEMQARRADIVARYEAGLGSHPGLETPKARAHVTPVWHLYVVRLNLDRLKIDRNEVMRLLAEQNIGTSVHYTPLHRHSFYANKYGVKPSDFPVADAAFHRMFSLPLSPAHTDDQIDRVITALREILDANMA